MYWVWSLYSRENWCELVDRSEEMIQPRDEEVRYKCAVLRSTGIRGFPWWPSEWLRVCHAVQGTQVQSLIWEDPACCRASTPQLLNLKTETREAAPMRCLHTTTRAQPPTLCNQRKPACSNKSLVPLKITRYMNKIFKKEMQKLEWEGLNIITL